MTARPRPLVTAAASQAGWVAGGAILPGPAYLAALTTAGEAIGRWDVLLAAALSLVPTVLQLAALRRTVLTGETMVTPTESARDDRGRRLLPRDADVLEQALAELAERRAADPARPPRRSGPDGTSSYPRVDSAQRMRATRPPVQRDPEPPAADPATYGGTRPDRTAGHRLEEG